VSLSLFLRLVLLNSVFGSLLAAGAVAYHGHVHPVALVAIGVVLAAYATGAALCLYLAWSGGRGRLLDDVAEIAEYLPGLAFLGTTAGFLIALSGDAADVQHRISGAATGLASTFIGVACWLFLSAQHRLVSRDGQT
jgi:hypothetical protein